MLHVKVAMGSINAPHPPLSSQRDAMYRCDGGGGGGQRTKRTCSGEEERTEKGGDP